MRIILKKLKITGVFILLITLIFTLAACDGGSSIVEEIEDEPEIVEFQDENLEEAIRDEINKPDGDLYLSDVKEIKDLNAAGIGIESLEGLQYLVNLESLFLNNNQISDIRVLSDLTELRSLYLWKNNVTDISPLENLTNLEQLNISANEVSDIKAVENLSNLYRIHFDQNEVNNISPISELQNLEWLTLRENKVSDINALEELVNIEELSLSQNKITDIGILENLNNLKILHLDQNEIGNISSLINNEGLESGDEIDISNNYLDLTTGSEDMDNIQKLINRDVKVGYEPQKEN